MVVAHVRVVGAEEDADVAGDPGQDQCLRAQIGQQRIERGLEEAECFGFSTK